MRAWLLPLGLGLALLAETALVRLALGAPPTALEPGAGPFELHVLCNRGTRPFELDRAGVQALLRSPEPLRRDLAMTWDGTRAAGEELQRAALEACADPTEATIGRFLLRYQVRSPDLAAIGDFQAALARR